MRRLYIRVLAGATATLIGAWAAVAVLLLMPAAAYIAASTAMLIAGRAALRISRPAR